MKDTFVRIILLLVVAVAVMAWLGWMTFSRTNDRATIEIDTQKIDEAADKAVEAGRQLANEATESIHEATEPETSEPQRSP